MSVQHQQEILPAAAKTKTLTLGELIAGTYRACGEKGASKILQLAMEADVLKFSRNKD